MSPEMLMPNHIILDATYSSDRMHNHKNDVISRIRHYFSKKSIIMTSFNDAAGNYTNGNTKVWWISLYYLGSTCVYSNLVVCKRRDYSQMYNKNPLLSENWDKDLAMQELADDLPPE